MSNNFCERNSVSEQYLSLNYQRFCRIVKESMDLAIGICNTDLEAFGMFEIFDVFNQIVQTAYVVNTGYWPLYDCPNGKSFCACGRFGQFCRHQKGSGHWISTFDCPLMPDQVIFSPKDRGPVKVLNSHTLFNIPNEGFPGYAFQMTITFEVPAVQRDKRIGIPNEIVTKTINARYNLMYQYYYNLFGITFKPNPMQLPVYGKYFSNDLPPRQPPTDNSCLIVSQHLISNIILELASGFNFSPVNPLPHIYVEPMKYSCERPKTFVDAHTQTPTILETFPKEAELDSSEKKLVEIVDSLMKDTEETKGFWDTTADIHLPSAMGLVPNSQPSSILQSLFDSEDLKKFGEPLNIVLDDEKEQKNLPQESPFTNISPSVPISDTSMKKISPVGSKRNKNRNPWEMNTNTSINANASSISGYELFHEPSPLSLVPWQDPTTSCFNYQYQSEVAREAYNQLSSNSSKRASKQKEQPRASTGKPKEAFATPPVLSTRRPRRKFHPFATYADVVQQPPNRKPVTKPSAAAAAAMPAPAMPAPAAEGRARNLPLASFLTDDNLRQLGMPEQLSFFDNGAVKKFRNE